MCGYQDLNSLPMVGLRMRDVTTAQLEDINSCPTTLSHPCQVSYIRSTPTILGLTTRPEVPVLLHGLLRDDPLCPRR